jgi:HAD superfamily hydrolase (TIGR01509 family)
MSKREGSTFSRVVRMLGVPADAVLFIDDNKGHVERAAAAGLRAIQFMSTDTCARAVRLATGMA